MPPRRPRRRLPFAGAAFALILMVAGGAGAVAIMPGAVTWLLSGAGLVASAPPSSGAVPGVTPAVPGSAPPRDSPGASPPGGSAGAIGSGGPSPASAEPAPTPPASPIAAIPPPAAPPVDPATAATLQRALEAARKSMVLPGAAATVILADGRTWTGVAGDAVAATHTKVTPETPFAIASVTKTFTAALILRLADQGRLTIDDPLARWLPDYPNAARITLKMLLQHTSGLADFFSDPKFDAALNRAKRHAWAPDEVLRFVGKPIFAPGRGWVYSNTNFVLLGIVAERAGVAPWAEQLRREFFVPLGLASTYVQGVGTPAVPPAHANRMFIGSGGKILPRDLSDGSTFVPFTAVATAAFSAGSIASTSGDLARWARALYGGDLLAPALLAQMLTFDPDIQRYAALAYGLGVSRVKIDGRFVAYGHTGALTGTRAAIRWLPKERVSVAVVFNRDLFRGDDLIRHLVAALYPRSQPDASPGASAGPSPSPGASAGPSPTSTPSRPSPSAP
jgi:D-alanyl-D-alanine carboxypeptidase